MLNMNVDLNLSKYYNCYKKLFKVCTRKLPDLTNTGHVFWPVITESHSNLPPCTQLKCIPQCRIKAFWDDHIVYTQIHHADTDFNFKISGNTYSY